MLATPEPLAPLFRSAVSFLHGNHHEPIRFPDDTPSTRALWFVARSDDP